MANVITDFKFINMAQAAAYPESERGRDRERKRTKRADREIHIQIRAAASRGPPVVLQLRRVQATLDPSTCPSCSTPPFPVLPSSPTLWQSVPLSFLLHDEFLLGCLGAANINRGFLITFALFFRFCLCFAFALLWPRELRDLP